MNGGGRPSAPTRAKETTALQRLRVLANRIRGQTGDRDARLCRTFVPRGRCARTRPTPRRSPVGVMAPEPSPRTSDQPLNALTNRRRVRRVPLLGVFAFAGRRTRFLDAVTRPYRL